MTLIDTSYFIRELYIPNLKSNASDGLAAQVLSRTNTTSIEQFIQKYEYEYLTKLLGIELADYFLKHQEQFATLKSFLVDEERKSSPIANYVYVFWAQNNLTQTTNAGSEVIGKLDHAVLSSEPTKQARAWNEMTIKNKIIRRYLCDNRELFEDYSGSGLGVDDGICKTWNFLGI